MASEGVGTNPDIVLKGTGGEGNRKKATGVFAEVEVFDPGENLWSSLPPMRTPRHGTGAGGSGGLFIVPGGALNEGFGAVDTVEALKFP